ncbi:MAG: GntR family transcriptional regulator [Spirochaetia bacterium]|nr:GntR family transcriptional regulator [Spirochaetia bacterium]MCF7945565.1 GntR family transcriptional regulator [Spirochaetia bacterium]
MQENPIFKHSLDGENETPLYSQLVLIIKQCIHSGELQPGDKMPSESEICTKYEISRSTARQAFGRLEKEGLIYRRRGLGSFIANQKLRKNINSLYSFTAQTLMEGMSPSSEVITFEVIEASPELMSIFKVTQSHFLLNYFYRIRKADNISLILEKTYIPYNICNVLTTKRLQNESVYDILSKECGVFPHHGVESYEVAQISKKEAQLLDCQPGTLAFAVERVGYLENNEVYEFTQSIVRADRCKFEVPLHNNAERPYRRIK